MKSKNIFLISCWIIWLIFDNALRGSRSSADPSTGNKLRAKVHTMLSFSNLVGISRPFLQPVPLSSNFRFNVVTSLANIQYLIYLCRRQNIYSLYSFIYSFIFCNFCKYKSVIWNAWCRRSQNVEVRSSKTEIPFRRKQIYRYISIVSW